MATNYPELNLYHSWTIDMKGAMGLAQQCEVEALAADPRIIHTEGANVRNTAIFYAYANTHGFMGHYLSTQHSIDCTVVAKDSQGQMQKDWSYSMSRDANTLSATRVAK